MSIIYEYTCKYCDKEFIEHLKVMKYFKTVLCEECRKGNIIQAGDAVFHKPSGEEWFILGVNKNRNEVCVAGWPPSIARLSDCEFVERMRGLTENELEYRNKEFGTNWD